MQVSEVFLPIVSGASLEEIFASLRSGISPKSKGRIEVRFRVTVTQSKIQGLKSFNHHLASGDHIVTAVINSCEIEDGSGKGLNLGGYMKEPTKQHPTRFTAYYRHEDKKGTLTRIS